MFSVSSWRYWDLNNTLVMISYYFYYYYFLVSTCVKVLLLVKSVIAFGCQYWMESFINTRIYILCVLLCYETLMFGIFDCWYRNACIWLLAKRISGHLYTFAPFIIGCFKESRFAVYSLLNFNFVRDGQSTCESFREFCIYHNLLKILCPT